MDAAASLRNQIKVLETKVEKQRKSIAQVEEERDRYLVEATDQARRVKESCGKIYSTLYTVIHYMTSIVLSYF